MGRLLAGLAAVAAFPFLYGVVAFTWFAVHDPDSGPLGQALFASVALVVAALLFAFAARAVAPARWLPAAAAVGVAVAAIVVAVSADDLPELLVVLGAIGLGAALMSGFVVRWEYGVGMTVVLVVVLLLVGGLAPA